MNLSCHSWAFNDLRLPEALGTIARMGFRYVDLGSGSHFNTVRAANPATRKAVYEELQADLEMFNLKLADVYLMLPRISISDETKRRTDITLFKAVLPMVKALGAPGVTISAGVVHPEDDEEAYARTTSALQEMLAAAQKLELPLSIEPSLNSMAITDEQALKLLEDVEGLKLTLDWGHLLYMGIKSGDIPALLDHTRHIQVRQAAPGKLQMPFDKGKLNIEELYALLIEANYQGALSIEYMLSGWQKSHNVSMIDEIIQLRDALRDARESLRLTE
ncbi:MAG: sugar phosphate isomerase/epimerase [Anaerolineae bacterium]|nr:sugar phosphate isomerase/epimerase [Anaerolineae bacterium]